MDGESESVGEIVISEKIVPAKKNNARTITNHFFMQKVGKIYFAGTLLIVNSGIKRNSSTILVWLPGSASVMILLFAKIPTL